MNSHDSGRYSSSKLTSYLLPRPLGILRKVRGNGGGWGEVLVGTLGGMLVWGLPPTPVI